MKKSDAPGTAIAVLASGNGSNLQAILDQVKTGDLPVSVTLVISDKGEARALARASAAGISTQVIAPGDYPDLDAWNRAITRALEAAQVKLVVLAGFMRIIGEPVLDAFHGRIVNIHPSKLPKYPGLDTYRKVLAAGDDEHGTSVHFVTRQLDGGPLIAQAILKVADGDNEQTLSSRIQAAEHWLYPRVIGWLAAGRVEMRDSAAWLDGNRLTAPVQFAEDGAEFAETALRPLAG